MLGHQRGRSEWASETSTPPCFSFHRLYALEDTGGADHPLFLFLTRQRWHQYSNLTKVLPQKIMIDGASIAFKGGPSLDYFASVWARNGINWTRIEGWDCVGTEDAFYKTVPSEWKPRVTYHQKCISTTPDIHPFIPSIIRQKVSDDASA